MVDLGGQMTAIKSEILNGWENVLSSCQFINGEPVKHFTENLSHYLDDAKVIPCANGTDAIVAALLALNLQSGDEIITVPFTFVATAEAIAILGLKPVFVDIDPLTYNIDINQIAAAISPKTKCIIPVHLYGQVSNMEAILHIAKKNGLFVVEDNAQAIGADYIFENGVKMKAGTIGDIGTTSFYPSKNLGAYGDAGAIFTRNEELYDRLKMIVNHGQRPKYNSRMLGMNSRLDSLQAVVLDVKLKHLNNYISKRQKVANYYDNAFKNIENITLPYRTKFSTHVFHQYTLCVNMDRDILKENLKKAGIPTMIYYPIPLHLCEAMSYLGYKKGDFPVTEKMAAQTISLPMHTELDSEQLEYIVSHSI